MTLIMPLLSIHALKTISSSRFLKEYDGKKQRYVLQESIRQAIRVAAYDAAEQKRFSDESIYHLKQLSGFSEISFKKENVELSFRESLENIISKIYPESEILKIKDFFHVKFFPDRIPDYDLHEKNLWKGTLPVEPFYNEEIDMKIEGIILKYQVIMHYFPMTNIDITAYSLPVTFREAEKQLLDIDQFEEKELDVIYLEENHEQTINGKYREAVSWCWNMYEYIFSKEYIHKLYEYAGSRNYVSLAMKHDEGQMPTGVTYNMKDRTMDIDLDQLESNILAFDDPIGGIRVNIKGKGADDDLLFIVYNAQDAPEFSTISFLENNQKPLVLLSLNTKIEMNKTKFLGGMILGPTSSLEGEGRIQGAVAFFSKNPIMHDLVTIIPDNWVKRQLAPYMPLQCLVEVKNVK